MSFKWRWFCWKPFPSRPQLWPTVTGQSNAHLFRDGTFLDSVDVRSRFVINAVSSTSTGRSHVRTIPAISRRSRWNETRDVQEIFFLKVSRTRLRCTVPLENNISFISLAHAVVIAQTYLARECVVGSSPSPSRRYKNTTTLH